MRANPARPVLYSFRRCPYAMRARMGIIAAGIEVELREVVLRDKPEEMIEASPKATVPVLILADGQVIDESLDVMDWALSENDPEGWLVIERDQQKSLVADCDDHFKPHLDRYKYLSRYPDEPDLDHRRAGLDWINTHLTPRLEANAYLFGDKIRFADIAIFPFIRQFAHVDRDWFYQTAPTPVCNWLREHLSSSQFLQIMTKFPKWEGGTTGVNFPE